MPNVCRSARLPCGVTRSERVAGNRSNHASSTNREHNTAPSAPARYGRRSLQSRHARAKARRLDPAVEFVTVMSFESLDAVRKFAGEDYGANVVPAAVRRILARFDDRSQHYELRAE